MLNGLSCFVSVSTNIYQASSSCLDVLSITNHSVLSQI